MKSTNKLLSREEFRNEVFRRDNYKCVVCGESSKDAHHIMERRLFSDGGYYLNNGASLCEKDHLLAEQTIINCDQIRELCKIKDVVLPIDFDETLKYDKWGNILLGNGNRIKGELFKDESVRKILKQGNMLEKFSKYIKYPRTYHLPWSKKTSNDDKILKSTSHFDNKNIVISIKLDGENTTLYDDHVHARSLDSENHESRKWIKNLWGTELRYKIPNGWRICGENLYATHTINYKNLKSYFFVYSIWDQNNYCLSWEDTKLYCEVEFNLPLVPIIYENSWDEEKIKNLKLEKDESDNFCEGYVVRLAESFSYTKFHRSTAKFVNENFNIVSNEHWKTNWKKNSLCQH